MDVTRLKDSWKKVAAYGDEVPLFFYSSLFITHPETRSLFPVSMAGQRDRLVGALGRIVSDVDRVDELVPFLQGLGRDHRKFAVVAEHYPAVGQALLHTLAHFLGPEWKPELAEDWSEAYGLVAKVMTEAADEAARTTPPWWEARVISHERRSADVAVITVQPEYELEYRPGQSVAVETRLRPNVWRFYTPANAPRRNGTIEFHVRLVGGGPVSTTLVQSVQPGDSLRLGAPVGDRLLLTGKRDLLLVAGGTGLAPFKAMIEQLRAEQAAGDVRRVSLFVGAPYARDHYDYPALHELAGACPWLRVVPCVSREAPRPGVESGDAVDVALRYSTWPDEDVYVCGSPEMVTGTLRRLAQAGVTEDRVRYEDFDTTSTSGGNP
ncbi:globin domain-containing protein [Streptomonospora sp. S1-112]|uniref:nitric oxide dioxygenase n=1 Tax=Streptomonospora mangrovi TaxID=2883123 RepID=A0A9X3NMX4_9ACTN|nr:globin domain-containing protein [Streptomonospora mangrovi]MDA0564714.1 globin domain-containing protein [Streptomonospora mangrovi]